VSITTTAEKMDVSIPFDEVLVRMVGRDEPVIVFRSGGREVFIADTRQRQLTDGATLSVAGLTGSIPATLA
jgi:hypothetical protein